MPTRAQNQALNTKGRVGHPPNAARMLGAGGGGGITNLSPALRVWWSNDEGAPPSLRQNKCEPLLPASCEGSETGLSGCTSEREVMGSRRTVALPPPASIPWLYGGKSQVVIKKKKVPRKLTVQHLEHTTSTKEKAPPLLPPLLLSSSICSLSSL